MEDFAEVDYLETLVITNMGERKRFRLFVLLVPDHEVAEKPLSYIAKERHVGTAYY